MKKRFLSMILTLCMILTLLPATAQAAATTTGNLIANPGGETVSGIDTRLNQNGWTEQISPERGYSYTEFTESGANTSGIILAPHSGTHFMGFYNPSLGSPSGLISSTCYQEIDITGIADYQTGTYSFTGWFTLFEAGAGNSGTATVTVSQLDANGSVISGTTQTKETNAAASSDPWDSFTLSGSVNTSAKKFRVAIAGNLPDAGLAAFDDLSLTLTTTPTNYNVWVGKTQVTSSNAGGITGDGITGKVTYDAATNTITLNNASISTISTNNNNSFSNTGAIYSSMGTKLKIKLVGTNTIDLRGVGSLPRPRCILAWESDLEITGGATDSLTVTGAPTNQFSHGLSGNAVTISGCTVSATGGASTGTSNNSCYGIGSGSLLTISNATVTATGGATPGSSFGLFGTGGIAITNSTVTATGGATSGNSFGLSSTGSIAITNSEVTAIGGTRAISTAPTLDHAYISAASTDPSGTPAAEYSSGSLSTYKYIKTTAGIRTPAAAEYAADAAEGTDYVTGDNTLTIKTARGAAFFSANSAAYLGYTVLLAGDIDIGSFYWMPVGNSSAFTGTFDGQGHALSNMTVTALNGNYAGVFGNVGKGGTVKNLTVSGSVNASSIGECYAGGITGCNFGLIDHCASSATITLNTTGSSSKSRAGGIVGSNYTGVIKNCSNTGAITATSEYGANAGGILGGSSGGSVANCFSAGAVSASGGSNENNAGGIVGNAYNDATLSNCYNAGAVSASGTAAREGGISGCDGIMNHCYFKNDEAVIGNNYPSSSYTATACGTFADHGGALTAGTADNCGTAQTLAHGNILLTALNDWVSAQKSTDYNTWNADSTPPANGGYPVLGAAFRITPTITITAAGKTYDGSAITAPTVSGNDGSGAVSWSYSSAAGGTYTSGLPSSAGTWYVKAGVAANGAYAAAESAAVEVTIAKADQTAPAAGAGYTLDYAAETITAAEGYELSTADTFASLLSSGASVTPGSTCYARLKADDNHNAGAATKITVPARPAIGVTLTVDTATEKVTVPAGCSYQIGSGSAVSVSADTAVTLDPGAALTYWKTATASAFKSLASSVTAPARLDKISSAALIVNSKTEKLPTTAAMQYKIGSGEWANCSSDMALTAFGWDGSADVTVNIRLAATGEKYASESISVTIPARDAAPAAGKTDETIFGKHDGTLTGMSDAMEYKFSTASGWTAVTGATVTGLEPGVYSVRMKATETKLCSSVQTLTVAPGQKLALTFDAKGGTAASKIENIEWQQTVTLPVTTRTGYTFGGWFTAADGAGTQLTASTKIEANTACYAKWTANTYTVTFHANGDGATGTMSPQTHTYDAPLALSENAFIRAEYRFSGWNTRADGGGNSYAAGQITQNLLSTQGANLDLYAQWTEASRYTISGIVTSGSPVSGATVTLKQGETIIASTVTGGDGGFIFANLLPGTYNLVVTNAEKTVTALCTVEKADLRQDVALPAAAASSSTLTIGKDGGIQDLPKIVVGGLDELAVQQNDNISMTVTQKAEDRANTEQTAIKSDAGGQSIGVFLNVTLQKGSDPLPDAGSVLAIVVPYDFSGKTNVKVWRYHSGRVENFKALENRPAAPYDDLTFFADMHSGLLYIYASKFSTYAVSYTTLSSGESDAYPVNIDSAKIQNGVVTASPASASMGKTVTVTAKPDAGCKLDKLTVTDNRGSAIAVKDLGNGVYSFIMPGSKVNVSAVFEKPQSPFTDVAADAYYHDAVLWAAEKGIAQGKSGTLFDPNGICTRAQAVAFLWRAMGSPEPTVKVGPFADVSTDAYYSKAVLWAVEKGITLGTSATTFSPDAAVTRAHTAAFLWRAAGKTTTEAANPFTDVKTGDYYFSAVLWAVKNGITTGTSDHAFSPDQGCSRAQIAAFLWRRLSK